MPEDDFSAFDQGEYAIADSARNLARTLCKAPAPEADRAAELRRYLVRVAEALADNWDRELASIDSKRRFAYYKSIWKLRDFAVELCAIPPVPTPGIRVLLEALRQRFLPNALLALRPTGLASISVREHFEPLTERLAALSLDIPTPPEGCPDRLLVIRYPQGEQENILSACTALPYFHQPRKSHVFATSAAGPAYFFALATEVENNQGFNSAYDLPLLCFVYELLEKTGWTEEAVIGPLLTRFAVHFEFGPDYLDKRILNQDTLQKMRETQEEYQASTPRYTPADFERDVPALWDQFRRLAPGDECRLKASREAGPSDVISILNAGWSFALLFMDEIYTQFACRTATDRYEARQEFLRFLAGLIEAGASA